jgi:hypothetical protein
MPGMRRWRELVIDREKWRGIIRQAKVGELAIGREKWRGTIRQAKVQSGL